MRDSASYFTDCSPTDSATIPTLPAQFTGFVGRKREKDEIRQHLITNRLLTLTGPGGIGKSRLVLQVAMELADAHQHHFRDGLWLVDLAHLSEPAQLPLHLARVLGFTELCNEALPTTLYTFLRTKNMLLILDNSEHLVDACARLVEVLLHACPDLSLLVTSRETLGLSGETVYRLSSLPVPPAAPSYSLEDLTQHAATELFLQRARTAHAHFRVTPSNMSALVEICQLLDGLPFALELAALWIRTMPVAQIAEQLKQNLHAYFSLLSNGSRNAFARQQSLQTMLDWSYNLLSEAEQRVLLCLAVFMDGWTLDAAQAVCSGAGLTLQAIHEGLGQLVNKSLVLVDEQLTVQISPTGETYLVEHARYRLSGTVRCYVQAMFQHTIASGAVQQQHLEYYLALAEKVEPELRGTSQLHWLSFLDAENSNFRVALEYARQLGRHEIGLRLASALWSYWMMRTHFSKGRLWLEEMLQLADDVSPAIRAIALYRASMLAFFQGDLERLDELAHDGLSLFRSLEDRQGIAVTLASLVHVALRQRNYEKAQHLSEESLSLARDVGDRWFIAFTLLPFAVLKIRQGDYLHAGTLGEEALRLFRSLGDRWGMAYSLDTLGQLAAVQGDYTCSTACYEQSHKLFAQMGDQIGQARSLLHLGLLFTKLHKLEPATSLLEESLKLCQISERRIGSARALLGLGRIKLQLDDYQGAMELLEESLLIFQEHGDVRGFAETLSSLRATALQQGKLQQVRFLLQHSLGMRYSIDDATDMFSTLESIAAAESSQVESRIRMRPVGWLQRVIGALHEIEYALESEHRATISPVRTIVTENTNASLIREYAFVQEDTADTPQRRGAEKHTYTSVPMPALEDREHQPLLLPDHLTNREKDVLRLVECGLSNGQIAQRLVISIGTVRTHLGSIYSKLGVTSRTAAAHYAHEHKLL